jgi:uncharacterized repeat protein (TIGR01451 family)
MMRLNKRTSKWSAALLGMLFLALGWPEQTALAQARGSFEITMEELGYDEALMRGPLSTTRYYFSLPATWAPQKGSYLALHLDYRASGHQVDPPAFLRVRLNDTLLHTEALKTSNNLRLMVWLPPGTLLASEEEYINTLKLELEVDEECERALLATLTVKNSSFLHFLYQKRPVRADLAAYPAPLYQPQAFEQAGLRFLLPSEPTAAELEAATMIAARLGRLTTAQLPLEVTLSSESQSVAPQEHVMIIGRPDDQPLLQQLSLPLAVAARQLSLSSQMPATIKAGEPFSYTLSVANSSEVTRSLTVQDRLPAGGTLVSCSEACNEIDPGLVLWEIGGLAPGEQVSATLTVQVDLPAPGEGTAGGPGAGTAEHTASLLDGSGRVLNVDTLSAQVGAATADERVSSQVGPDAEEATAEGGYLFVHEGQGVAETDGLVQEIISPWQSDRAAVVVTGLDDTALLKAGRALGSDNHFPGMWGMYALVEATQPLSQTVAAPVENISVASLGYQDDSISSLDQEYLEYRFEIPAGWELGDEAYLALHFAHGTALNEIDATLEVMLNGLPIGSLPLDESNSFESWTVLPLPATATQTGANRIRIQVSANKDYICEYITSDRYWLSAFDDSFLHLPHESAGLVLTLDKLPYPFVNDANLGDVAFLLPERPSATEVEGLLRLAFQMGSVAGGQDFAPRVALGGEPGAESWAGHHLVALGAPADNAYLAAANDELPLRFRPGTNEIEQDVDRVVYRLAPGESLGFVQELLSPWDQERAMLAVMGTNSEGVAWAIRALVDEEVRGTLSGDLASIREERVWSIDTRQSTPEELASLAEEMGLGLQGEDTATPTLTPAAESSAAESSPAATATQPPTDVPPPLPSATPTEAPSLTPTATATPLVAGTAGEIAPAAGSSQPSWLLPLLAISGLIVVVAAGVAVWQGRR